MLTGIIGILVVGLLIAIKIIFDKDKLSTDTTRQFNELRSVYQKMEYSLSVSEKRINDLNEANRTLHEEIEVLMSNPLVNSDKLAKRIKTK